MLPERKRVNFTGAFGHRIAARLDLPQRPRAFALFAHCFTCGKDLKAANWISREMVDRKIAVLRFDFTGVGESEGEFADTNFSTNVADLLAAVEYLRSEHAAPQLLIGHSLGGAAALIAAARVPECVAVCTIAAPSDTQHLRDHLAAQAPAILQEGEAQVNVMGHRVRIRRQMLEDFAEQDLPAAIAELGRALLVFHSPEDRVLAFTHAERIFAAAHPPKSLISLPGADHLLIANEEDARFVATVIAAWAHRYVQTN